MGEDWAIFQNVYIGGTYSPAPNNSFPCLLVYIFFVGPTFLIGNHLLINFPDFVLQILQRLLKAIALFSKLWARVFGMYLESLVYWYYYFSYTTPSPVIWNRTVDENGILGGNWHFRWGYFFHVRLENSCIKNREYESQRKKNDSNCNFYNSLLLVPYPNKFLVVCICNLFWFLIPQPLPQQIFGGGLNLSCE